MTVDIVIENWGWQNIAGLEALATRAAEAVLSGDRRSSTIVFSNDAEVRTLNKEWRGQDKPTNVLSFPMTAGLTIPEGEEAPLGDLILAYETVAREASEQGKTLEAHTAHLIVHGILHLLGYDHEDDAEADAMEAKERDILDSLGFADPYES